MDEKAYIRELEMRIASLEEIEKQRKDAAARYERDEKYRLSMLGHDNMRWDFSDNMYLLPSADWKNDIRLQQSGLNQWLWFDRWGLNPDFIKRFPNKIVNSGFEWHDPDTKKPLFWDTEGRVTDWSNWEGTYALELGPGQMAKQSTLAEIGMGHTKAGADPAWWENFPTRVSFKHKGGKVKAWVERYDTGEKLKIYDNSQQGNIDQFGHDVGFIREGYELEFGPIDNWAVFWDENEEGQFVDRQEDNMKYVTFGYASFWFMPVTDGGRVRVCFQNVEVEGEVNVRMPFWEETKPPEEWTKSSYRPLKILQGYETSTRSISNFVPTNDGRHMCAWISGGEVVMGYTENEEAYLTTHRPCTETLPTGIGVIQNVTPPTMFKRDDGKVLLFVADATGSGSPSVINCYISETGNGDDWALHGNVYTNNTNETGFRIKTGDTLINVPLKTKTGRLILTGAALRHWISGHSIVMAMIWTSDDGGVSWSRRRTIHFWGWQYHFGQPAQLPDGSIFSELQLSDGSVYLFRSLTDGQSWSSLGRNFSSFDGLRWHILDNDSRSPCWFGSFYYDSAMDRLYRVVPAIYSGCGIYFLDNPTKDNIYPFNNGEWVFFMYIHENSIYRPRIWTTPKDRIAVLLRNRIIGLAEPGGNVYLDAIQIEPDFTFKHPSFYTQGPRSLSPAEIIGMPGMGTPSTDPETGEPVLLPSKHAETHCIDGDDHVSPECIGAVSKEEFLAMLAANSYRQAYFNSDQWVVEHFLDCEPVFTIWKGPIGDFGFGTQPFGTSPFGGGVDASVLSAATHEPTSVNMLDKNTFVVNWASPESGVVVAIKP